MELSSKDGQILQHIVRYCNQIDTTIGFFHLTKDDFANNFFMQNALAMPISQIGELVKKLTSDFRTIHSKIPWRAIAGMRDHLTHNYTNMDIDVTWEALTVDIPALNTYCKKILIENNLDLPEIEEIHLYE